MGILISWLTDFLCVQLVNLSQHFKHKMTLMTASRAGELFAHTSPCVCKLVNWSSYGYIFCCYLLEVNATYTMNSAGLSNCYNYFSLQFPFRINFCQSLSIYLRMVTFDGKSPIFEPGWFVGIHFYNSDCAYDFSCFLLHLTLIFLVHTCYSSFHPKSENYFSM